MVVERVEQRDDETRCVIMRWLVERRMEHTPFKALEAPLNHVKCHVRHNNMCRKKEKKNSRQPTLQARVNEAGCVTLTGRAS
jgi:hypothetical protein